MGVPGFFLWLLKKYKNQNFVVEEIEQSIDDLYFDTNCLIHPQCYKVLAENTDWKNKGDLEKKMIQESISYLDSIVRHVNPCKRVMVSIDGPAPMGKIKQQRQRRFKSYHDHIMYSNLRKKFKKEVPNYWNNSAITPGTQFMHKLHLAMQRYCKKLSSEFQNVEIIYSSPYTPGEGEHKILEFLRYTSTSNTFVVYGLDADLIFLALSLNKRNVYLLRENITSENLEYVSIDVMKDLLFNAIENSIMEQKLNKLNLDQQGVIQDFIFLCFLLGNDFLPHGPSMSIYPINRHLPSGLDYILNAYCKCVGRHEDTQTLCSKNKNLENVEINQPLLVEVLECLVLDETTCIQDMHRHRINRFIQRNGTYEKEVEYIENMGFRINNPLKLQNVDNNQEIDNWKFRYYEHYFKESSDQKMLINQICSQYMKGMKWTIQYYMIKCPSWEWFYEYSHAPFLSDLLQYLKSNNINNIDNINFDSKITKPLLPFQQLVSVLPPQSFDLLPESLRCLTTNPTIEYLFPKHFEQDFLYKKKYFMSIPMIPNHSPEILNTLDSIQLNSKDLIYNKKLPNKFYNKQKK